MKKSSLDLDIIYVNYFAYEKLIKSLETLHKKVYDKSFTCNIYLVDNSYCKANKNLIKKLKNFISFYSSETFKINFIPSDFNLGFSKGCNKAAFLGNAPNILFINCDTNLSCLRKNGLNNLLKRVKNDVVIVGPKVISEDGLFQESCFKFDAISILLKPLRHIYKIGILSKLILKIRFLRERINLINYSFVDQNKPQLVDWLSGCFMIVERSFFEKVKGFDERFFLYFEDVDICRMAKDHNKKVLYDPTQTISHIGKFESAKKKGILNSVLTNPASRMHLISWLKYIIKWRVDYFFY